MLMGSVIALLWMDEILHHLRHPGMVIPLKIPTTVMVSTTVSQVVRDGFRGPTHSIQGLCGSYAPEFAHPRGS